MERRQSASCSLGCHVRSGITRPKCTACCPVPPPTSRTSPDCGNTRESTSAMGCLLRSAEGLHSRPSPEVFRSSSRILAILQSSRQLACCLSASTPARYRIGDTEPAPLVLERVAEGVERSDHLQ